MAPISDLVDRLKEQTGSSAIPYVDPDTGGVGARLLFLLADPGPRAAGTPGASGMLSWDNDDPTASMCAELFAGAGIPWGDALPWNAWPWPKESAAGTRQQAEQALVDLIRLLPRLRVALVLGGEASTMWGRARLRGAIGESVRTLNGGHPSTRGLTGGSRQTKAEGVAELRRVFREAAELLALP